MNPTAGPQFSILTPVYDPPVPMLRAMVASVQAQTYRNWQLVLVDDCSPNPAVRRELRELAAGDDRITLVEREANGGIVAASQDALMAAVGEYVALLDHDDLLAADALTTVAATIARYPDADYLYSDEDKVSADGVHFDVFRKPDWSPERLRCQMYTGHLSVLRTGLVRAVGGFQQGSDGSQDHDLALRVTEKARRVVHIPHILYHWRAIAGSTAHEPDAKPYAWEAGLRAVQRHLDRTGIAGRAYPGALPGTYRIVRRIPPHLRISVVIPTRGTQGLIWGEWRVLVVETVRSVLARTQHADVEIVVVYDEPTPPAVLAELQALVGERLVLVPFREPFNFSAKCNVGFIESTGDVVVFLNDDMQAVSDGCLEQLVAPLSEPGVAATGARLIFADGRLQHAGHVYARGEMMHACLGWPEHAEGPFRALLVNRECSGVTAACLAMARATFEQVGGFCEELPGNFNDVDMSYKLRRTGGRILWLADVTLYHFESQTRETTVEQWEYDHIMRRWGTPEVDPYFPVDYS